MCLSHRGTNSVSSDVREKKKVIQVSAQYKGNFFKLHVCWRAWRLPCICHKKLALSCADSCKINTIWTRGCVINTVPEIENVRGNVRAMKRPELPKQRKGALIHYCASRRYGLKKLSGATREGRKTVSCQKNVIK